MGKGCRRLVQKKCCLFVTSESNSSLCRHSGKRTKNIENIRKIELERRVMHEKPLLSAAFSVYRRGMEFYNGSGHRNRVTQGAAANGMSDR